MGSPVGVGTDCAVGRTGQIELLMQLKKDMSFRKNSENEHAPK